MKTIAKQKVSVGLSGGVDSAVAAFLLKEAGYEVNAVFMKNWHEEESEQNFCPQAQDLRDAEAVADRLRIPLTVVSFTEEYWARVFTHFLAEYQAGRTPNPDILCNKEIKFSAFLEYAINQGADLIATGHYARKAVNEFGQTQLLKAIDSNKDQSYFLYAVSSQQIAQTLFPLGEMEKSTVRTIAKEIGLNNHSKKDSTGICFIGERRFKSFLAQYIPAQSGDIQTLDQKVIGRHDGLMFYTIGQRQGLQLGGKAGYAELPWYVVKKDCQKNILYVAQGEDPALYHQQVFIKNLHWITAPPTLTEINTLSAKIRYRQADQACSLHVVDAARGLYCATFREAQRAVAPGQSIVFYDEDVCLGGGIIQ